jgi:hypothetical protein
MADPAGWVPVIGPEHEDYELLGFVPEHFHIDWRFVDKRSIGSRGANMGVVVCTTVPQVPVKPPFELKLRRLLCKRAMPTFPGSSHLSAKWGGKLEAAFAECTLKPGLVCPHRGIPLADFVQPDGTVTCPAHGLRWDVTTGKLLKRAELKS